MSEADDRAVAQAVLSPQSFRAGDCARIAEQLNRECQCVTLDRERLRQELMKDPAGADLYRMVTEERPTLFSASAVFAGEASLARMREIIGAVEEVVALPAYRERVLAQAPASARYTPRNHGVFLGYDFHLGKRGPQLIEINTNAGGGLLNAVLARAQQACCEPVAAMLPGSAGRAAEQAFFDMFLAEWRAARGSAVLSHVAIVDERPEQQFMLPEFVLFKKLFERFGLTADIVDPTELTFEGGQLRARGRRVDLVYNRLTDFALDAPPHAALRAAYLADAVVVTPFPRAHALYADKRNLTLLTDSELLEAWQVAAHTREILLSGIPRSEIVRPERADDLWQRRRQLFFKPAAGYGSKAAYRGDKLTRRVFEEILSGAYIAQEMVPPSERRVEVGEERVLLKTDLRCYVYRGEVQLLSARLYQGQTTNFRTAGGGFAPVLTVPGILA